MADSKPGTGTSEDTSEDSGALEVAIDLIAEDALLREAIRAPLPVRLPTGGVISVPHIADWPHMANRVIAIGAFDNWARLVLSPKDYEAFTKADLKTYQVQRIVEGASAAGDITPGKPSPSSPSRRGTRRS